MSVALKKSPFPGVSSQELAQQLAGYQKFRKKVPLWHRTPGIYYPPGLSLEQASSELTARYKAGLVSGNLLVDITGGSGVDSYFFSLRLKRVIYCELDPALAEISAHNFEALNAGNIRVHAGDGIALLRELESRKESPDWVYADPSRRHARKGKVIRLQDYQPDIPANLEELMRTAGNLLVKTSPMLDIASGLETLSHVRNIHVVAVRNEVKELLWVLGAEPEGPPKLTALDLADEENEPFVFTAQEEAQALSELALPSGFLYEPGAALLKAGAFRLTGQRFGLHKLHRHTHLYTSGQLIPFPGRRFRIVETLPYKPGKLGFDKAHINSRNFPESVAAIRKRTGIKSGGDTYLFFVRTADEALRVLVTSPV